MVWQPSLVLWSYMEGYLFSLWSLSKSLGKQKGDLLTDKRLSFVAILSYLMSGVFHRPLSRSWWNVVKQVVDDNRSKKSDTLFLRNFFNFDHHTHLWSISHTFTIPELRRIYGDKLKHQQISIEATPESTLLNLLHEFQHSPQQIDQQQQQQYGDLFASDIPPFAYNTQSLGTSIIIDTKNYPIDQNDFYYIRLFSLIRCHSFTPVSAKYFVEIIMQQLVNMYSTWDKRIHSDLSPDVVYRSGRSMFRSTEKLFEILKVSTNFTLSISIILNFYI